WPRCGATGTDRAPAPSTPTCGPCAASSARRSSAPCTASGTAWRTAAHEADRVRGRADLRPLDPLKSIKMKLGAVIVASVLVTVLVVSVGRGAGMSAVASALLACALALGLVQILARGMTSPLREMAVAARAMAWGDYDRRVTATSRDEVGELGRAFNAMAGKLAEGDRGRR